MAHALRQVPTGLRPAAEDIATLPFVDRWLIWCLRRLYEAQQYDELPCPILDGAFAAAGLSAAGAALYGFSAIFCGRCHRQPDVRAARDRRVSGDERAFLRFVAALQRGDGTTADAVLRRWLPVPDRGRAKTQARLFARELAAAGYRARSCTEPATKRFHPTWQPHGVADARSGRAQLEGAQLERPHCSGWLAARSQPGMRRIH